jgi:hypothetical protein
MTQVSRNYSHKEHGDIGSAIFAVEALGKGKIAATLNGVELPEASLSYLLTFALQSLQDAYAGSKTADEATSAFDKKLKAVQEGTIGTRGTGDGASYFTKVARSIVTALLRGKGGDTWKEFDAIEDDDVRSEKLDAIYTKNEVNLQPKVQAEIARRAKEKADKKAITSGLELDL